LARLTLSTLLGASDDCENQREAESGRCQVSQSIKAMTIHQRTRTRREQIGN